MLLRWILNTYLSQTVQTQVRQAVQDSLQAALHPAAATDEGAAPDAPPREVPPCEIAFIFALGVEAGGLVDLLEDVVTTRNATFLEHSGRLKGRQVVIAETGVGREAAARGTADLVALHRPGWVVSAGFAGGLDEPLRLGHLLLVEDVVDARGERLATGLKFDRDSAPRGVHFGRLLTVDELVRDRETRRRLAADHQALACDMETFAVAQVCRDLRARLMGVRIISDAVDAELPPEVECLLQQKSWASKLGAAAGALLNRPAAAGDLWALHEEAQRLSDRLARFLVTAAERLV